MKWLQGKPVKTVNGAQRQQQRNQHQITQHIQHPRAHKPHHRIRLFKSSSSTYDEPQTRPFDRPAELFPMVMTCGRPWIFHRSPPSRSLQRALFSAHTVSTQLFSSSLKSSQRDLSSHVLLTSSTSSERLCLRAFVRQRHSVKSTPRPPQHRKSDRKNLSLQAQYAHDQKEQANLSSVTNFHVWRRTMR